MVYAGFDAVEPVHAYTLTGPGGGDCPVVTASASAVAEHAGPRFTGQPAITDTEP